MTIFDNQIIKRGAVALAASALLGVGVVVPAQALPVQAGSALTEYMPNDNDSRPVPCQFTDKYKDPRTKAMTDPDELWEWYQMCEGFYVTPVPF